MIIYYMANGAYFQDIFCKKTDALTVIFGAAPRFFYKTGKCGALPVEKSAAMVYNAGA